MNSHLWLDSQMRKPTTAEILAANVGTLLGAHKAINTQVKLAKKSGLGQSSISRVLGGEGQPRAGTVGAIAEAFGVTPAQLLTPEWMDTAGNENVRPREMAQSDWPFKRISKESFAALRDWQKDGIEDIALQFINETSGLIGSVSNQTAISSADHRKMARGK